MSTQAPGSSTTGAFLNCLNGLTQAPPRRAPPKDAPTMSLPAPNHPCWQKLATGALNRLKTQHLGTQLLSKRIERSTDPMDVKVKEIQAFFAKWERALPAEVAQLAAL
ncbi:MAG: hypothetical protein RIQ53_4070 [Pseudomonadota bacterium]|jgi:hypothetical protein